MHTSRYRAANVQHRAVAQAEFYRLAYGVRSKVAQLRLELPFVHIKRGSRRASSPIEARRNQSRSRCKTLSISSTVHDAIGFLSLGVLNGPQTFEKNSSSVSAASARSESSSSQALKSLASVTREPVESRALRARFASRCRNKAYSRIPNCTP